MLQELDLPTLQQRRKVNRLTYLYKIVGGMVPAVDTCEYLVRQRFKRRVKAVTFDNFETTNIYRKSDK